jgi:hypothetical protein
VTPALSALDLVADPARWRAAGFAVEEDVLVVGTVAIRFVDGGREGLAGWELDGDLAGPAPAHGNGAFEIDHVVLMTPDLGATTDDLAAQGFEARRTRDAGGGVTQVFYRFANGPILEVVGPITAAPHPYLWGVVFTTADLDAIGPSKDAVQPGRRIATVPKDAGLGTAVAFMSV